MDKAVRVFFSQPMHGLTNEEIIFERNLMKEEFRNFLCYELGFDNDVEIIDVNYNFNDPGPEDAGRLWYLGRSIQNMDKADYVCFHSCWTSANGCWVEHSAAEMYFKWRFGDTAGQDQVSEHIREIAFGRNK